MGPSENGPEEKVLKKDEHISKLERRDRINHLPKPDKYRKIDSSLLPLLDNKYLPPGYNLEDYLDTLKSLGQYLPAGSSIPKKDIYVPADLVYLEISLVENYSIETVKPYTWLVVNHSDKHRLTIAWVKLGDLEVLVTQDAVRFIRSVIPPALR